MGLRETRKRWRDVAIYALLAGAVVVVFLPTVGRHLGAWATALDAPTALAVAVLALGCLRPSSPRWRGLLNPRAFKHYPPCWIAAFPGLCIVLLAAIGSPRLAAAMGMGGFLSTPTLIDALILVLVTIYCLAAFLLVGSERVASLPASKEPHTLPGGGAMQLSHDWEKLEKWFTGDSPISSPDEDIFGHALVGERLAERVLQDPAPTMMLVGPAGSGKSSIERLFYHALQARGRIGRDVELVTVSLWPFESASAAVRGILHAVIEGLSRHADTTGISHLPEAYVDAVTSADPRLASLARFIGNTQDPKALISGIRSITCALQLRIVLWIEDMERFDPDPRSSDQETRLAPIRSLLHQLDESSHISVVVASTSLSQRIDLDKIARYVEHPPALDPQRAWGILAFFRCSELGKEFVDLASAEGRSALNMPKDPFQRMFKFLDDGNDHPQPPLNIVQAIRTPRLMKQMLRIVHETWSKLLGEIDFDDVLMITAVRVAMPDVYAFVDRNIVHFSLDSNSDSSSKRKREELEELLSDHDDKQVANSVRLLLKAIFLGTAGVDPRRDRPQGFQTSGPREYWERYSTLAPIPEEEQDQVLVRTINDWKEGRSNQLVGWLTKPGDPRHVGAFPSRFAFQDVVRLLEESCDSLGRTSAAAWGEDLEAPGMYTLRGLIRPESVDQPLLLEVLTSLLKRWAPTHLPLSYGLVEYFGRGDQQGFSALLDEDGVLKVAEALTSCLLTSFDRDPSLLIVALQDSSVPVVRRVCDLIGEANHREAGRKPFDGWGKFANTLLSAAEIDRDRVLPEILLFITRTDFNGLGERRDMIEREVAERLFDIGRLQQVLGDWPGD